MIRLSTILESPGGQLAAVSLICGVGCAVIAASKHRDTIKWFLLGALLPVLGLILAIAAPRLPSRSERRLCPSCMESIHAAARVCPHCRQSITATAPEPAPERWQITGLDEHGRPARISVKAGTAEEARRHAARALMEIHTVRPA